VQHDFCDDLAFAHEVADAASIVTMRHFSAGVVATSKADGSPVTEADRAVEELIRASIHSRYPNDGIIGEEFGTLGLIDGAHRRWIVDPIDGTSDFARNDPNSRIHLALQVGDRLEVAVVAAPALGLRWWAQRGSGAFEAVWSFEGMDAGSSVASKMLLGRKLSVSTRAELHESQIACTPTKTRARVPPQCGIAAPSPLPLVELVRGEIDAFVAEGFHIWDHAPWILLVEEAGGRFTDRSGGNSGDQGGGVYSNTPLHSELVRALGYGRSSSQIEELR
jgi:histidinol-phosphatase